MRIVGSVVIANHPDQVFNVTLSGVQCRARMWYQPSDFNWYVSLEAPTGTPVVSCRRLVNGSLVLFNRLSLVKQDLRCDPVSPGSEARPGRLAWMRTHLLNIVEHE